MKVISKTRSDFMPDVDVWVVRSDSVERDFRIIMASPTGSIDDAPPGILFGLDANYSAGPLISAVRSMGSAGELPALHVAAIGYPLDAPSPSVQRLRDLTPWPSPSVDSAAAVLWGSAAMPSGGGAAFLAFITNELKPWLSAEYGIRNPTSGLSGSSLAGLFTLWTLLTDPTAFDRYNIVSPSAFVADYAVLDLLEQRVASNFAPSARAFVSAGGFETPTHLRAWIDALPPTVRETYAAFQNQLGWMDMAADAEKVANLLRKIQSPRFAVEHLTLASETHESVYLPAVSKALRMLFPTPVTESLDRIPSA